MTTDLTPCVSRNCSTVFNSCGFFRASWSGEYHRSGVSVPVDAVLDRLQAKLDAKRKKLAR